MTSEIGRAEPTITHLLLVREGKLVVVARREVAGPRVEDLDNLSTIIDLVARVLALGEGEGG